MHFLHACCMLTAFNSIFLSLSVLQVELLNKYKRFFCRAVYNFLFHMCSECELSIIVLLCRVNKYINITDHNSHTKADQKIMQHTF